MVRPRRATQRGTLHRVNGDLAQAEGCHQQALELARAIANSWDKAHALVGLGRCALAVGHPHSKPWHRAGAPAAGWPRYETQIRRLGSESGELRTQFSAEDYAP